MLITSCNGGKDKEKEKKLNEKERKCKIELPKKVSLDEMMMLFVAYISNAANKLG